MSVFFYGCITMDGYLADKNHSLDWLYQTGSVEETDYESFYRDMDITLIGKKDSLLSLFIAEYKNWVLNI